MSEHVMVVKTERLHPFLHAHEFDLFRSGTAQILDCIAEHYAFIPRDEAELAPEFKQIIPYVMLRCEDDVFVLRRTSRQREFRLHNKLGLGIGGHINPDDGEGCFGLIRGGLYKELHEEMAITTEIDEAQFLGILNDESTEVSRVHLGLVYVVRTSTHAVAVRETEKMTGEWTAMDRLRPLRDSFESWSQIVLDQWIALELPAVVPTIEASPSTV